MPVSKFIRQFVFMVEEQGKARGRTYVSKASELAVVVNNTICETSSVDFCYFETTFFDFG